MTEKMEPLAFANFNGEALSIERLVSVAPKRKKTKRGEPPKEYHNGWRVLGIPPGALEAAHEQFQSEAASLCEQGKESKDWNQEHWLMNAKRKAVRSKPYEVPQAAQECKAMAERAGWLRVEVVELKKSKDAA